MSVIENSLNDVPAALASLRVCAICVTYHPDADLPARLSKVLRQVSHLVVVDNGSSPEAVRMLNAIAKDDHVTLVLCGENLGLGRGLNLGIEHATQQGYDFALLLDQDTSVNEDLVSVLTRIYQGHVHKARLAIVGAGYKTTWKVEPRAEGSPLAYDEVEAVIVSGSLLALEAFRQIGPFREGFFVDHVDTEYCARAISKGYLVVQAQRVLMVHDIGNPSQHRFLWMTKFSPNHSPDRLYYQARNDAVMLRESGKYRAGSWRFKALGRAIRRCKRIVLFEQHKAAKVFGVVHGWYDGLRGRQGRRFPSR